MSSRPSTPQRDRSPGGILAGLRRLRHGRLKPLDPAWRLLGRLYRQTRRSLGLGGSAAHFIGGHGPFLLDADFAFSDFTTWGAGHNRGFEKCVEACRGKHCVLDVGAHIGLLSLPVSRVLAPGGTVFAFEPAAGNLAYLRQHLDGNGITNVEVVDCLVGAEDDPHARFHERPGASGMNSVVARTKDAHAYRVTTKPQITLDRFCGTRNLHPEVIKIDVEGAELMVLEGAAATLSRARPMIFLSLHPGELAMLGHTLEDVQRLVRSLGYRLLDMDGRPARSLRLDEYLMVGDEAAAATTRG